MKRRFSNIGIRQFAAGSMAFMLLCFSAGKAAAEIEIEVDPIAFALKGHSFHVAYAGDENRFDLGIFALELPEDSSNKYFTVFFKGYGVKWDYFGGSVEGGFIGVQASTANVEFEYDDPDDNISKQSTRRRVNNYGVRVGYRFGADGFYITPWISADKNELIGDPVVLAGEEYDLSEISLFPTVHIGYRF
ncbi:MAG: hypothetical protein HQM13_24225 [SAR324 cluster bacterium]|nr:hypothetical protein [SAR324 cluster bacterium]